MADPTPGGEALKEGGAQYMADALTGDTETIVDGATTTGTSAAKRELIKDRGFQFIISGANVSAQVQYSTDGLTWVSIGSAITASALYQDRSAFLYYRIDYTIGESSSLTVKVNT